MPAPVASMMQMAAKLQFASNGLTVPTDWQQPTGNPAGKHYVDAFKPEERAVPPDVMIPPLFLPASVNKYHVDLQKSLNSKFSSFLDGICQAICGAWSQWQTATMMTGVIINAVSASLGTLAGPPWTPLILASAPKATPMEMKYSNVIATVLGTAWLTYTASIKLPGLPLYPAFAAFPAPVAPPMPSLPVPLISLAQVTASVQPAALKGQMMGMLGDPMAPFHKELFDAVAQAFGQCFQIWQASTQVTNILGMGPVPTFAPPFVPVGPVVMGVGNMMPGGLV